MQSDRLSHRESECANYLLKGLSAKEIGKVLGVSHRTVEGHLSNLRKKLQCSKTSSVIVKLMCEQSPLPNLD